MDRDDGAQAAPRASNDDDVLVLGIRQALQRLVRLGQLQSTHDQILWAIEPDRTHQGPLQGQKLRDEPQPIRRSLRNCVTR